MPNATSPMVEQRVIAFSLWHPGFGPARISAELARPKCGGILLSLSSAWRVLRCHGLGTRTKRLSLVAGYAAPSQPPPLQHRPQMHFQARRPGELVQFHCFHVGRLSRSKGTVWQYTAIDVASAYTWAELHAIVRNPSAQWTSRLARRVAGDLSARGWKLETVMTDNGSEFRARQFGETISALGARQRFIQAGRPQTSGCAERVQGTILNECWNQPSPVT